MREQIDLLEEKLDSLSKSVKVALYFFIPILVFTLLYFLYISDAFNRQSSNENEIVKTNHYLHQHSQKVIVHKIAEMKKKILYLKSKISENREKLTYLKTKLVKNNFLFLSQKDFTQFLNDLLNKSVKNDFLINNLNISKDNSDFIGKLKYKKVVSIQGSGEFLNTLKFIRDVEENSMLMEIKNLNIETNGSTPQVTYDIKFYGVKR